MRMMALAFAIVAAASGAAFAESKNETISDAEAQRYMAFFDQVVATVSSAKTDCPKMSADLGKLFDANTKIIDDANKAKDQGKKLPADYDKRVKAGAEKLVADLKTCAADPAVQATFKRLDKK